MTAEALKTLIFSLSTLNAMLLLMHEFDAFHLGEWKMFGILKRMDERAQYLLFLYLHIPLVFLLFYYLYSTLNGSNFYLWVGINAFNVVHLCIHLVANKWKTNVFSSAHSYVFIAGTALISFINLMLSNAY